MDNELPGTSRARALLGAGRAADALSAVLPDLATDPDNFPALCAAAEARIDLGEGDEAVRLCQHAITLHPEDWQPLRLLAYALMVTHKLGPARDAAQRAIDLAPDTWYTHFTRASVDVRGGRLSPQSVYSAEVAVQLAPLEPATHLLWGQVMRMDNNPRGAEAEFREALRLDPQNRRAMMELGISNLRSGDNTMASRAFSDILATNADSAVALFNLRVAAGLIFRNLTFVLLALTAVGWVFVVAVTLEPTPGAAERARIALVVAAVLTLAVLVFGAVRMRQVIGHRFFRVTRSVLRVDRLLAIWGGMLVLVLVVAVIAIWLPIVAAGWAYFLALGVVGVAKYVESVRNRRLLEEKHRLTR